jgi:hypothetical protein
VKPCLAANERKKSMWQLAMAATKASSGSTPEGSEKRQPHHMRRGGSMDARAAIECPFVRATIAVVEEAFVALSRPADGGFTIDHA